MVYYILLHREPQKEFGRCVVAFLKMRNKSLIIIILSIVILCATVILYNPNYFAWHFWYKVKLSPIDNLYIVLPEKEINYRNSIPKDWKLYDLLEVKIQLPEKSVQFEKIFTFGFKYSNDNFGLSVANLLAGRDSQQPFVQFKEHKLLPK